MIFQLVNKADLLANSSFKRKNINLVRNILLNNLYSTKCIEHNIKRRIQSINNRKYQEQNSKLHNFD